MTTLVVVARARDLSVQPFNAFVDRHRRLVSWLAEDHRVVTVGLRTEGDDAEPPSGLGADAHHEVAMPLPDRTRGGQVRSALRRARGQVEPWQREVLQVVDEEDADVVVTLGPWLDDEYAPLWGRPAVHVLEEDLLTMPELASQSFQGRLFRRAVRAVGARGRRRPELVLVISDAEVAGARRRFPRSEVVRWPYALPAADWPRPPGPSDGGAVLVVGNLAEGRNAEGLAEVIEALEADEAGAVPPVVLVSGAGLHEALHVFVDRGIACIDDAPDLWARYRTSRLSLVAADRASGFKTTVLQAWAAGSPVVVHQAVARTLGTASSVAVAVGADPVELAAQVRRLWSDDQARAGLAEAGLCLAHARHDEQATKAEVVRQISALAATAGGGR